MTATATSVTGSDDAAAARAAKIDRALGYPFPRPDGDFLFRDGKVTDLPADFDISSDMIAVLGYGSNAAPVQLRRKYGTAGVVPVLAVDVSGIDVVYSPGISHYASVPATVTAAPGVVAHCNVTMLDAAQLARMHMTEQGYLYCRLRRDAGVTVRWRGAPLDVDVFAYIAPKLLVDGNPVALTEIRARDRALAQKSQREINECMLGVSGWDETLDDFIVRNVDEAQRRNAVQDMLDKMRDDKVDDCWEVLEKLGTRLGWDESNEFKNDSSGTQ